MRAKTPKKNLLEKYGVHSAEVAVRLDPQGEYQSVAVGLFGPKEHGDRLVQEWRFQRHRLNGTSASLSVGISYTPFEFPLPELDVGTVPYSYCYGGELTIPSLNLNSSTDSVELWCTLRKAYLRQPPKAACELSRFLLALRALGVTVGFRYYNDKGNYEKLPEGHPVNAGRRYMEEHTYEPDKAHSR